MEKITSLLIIIFYCTNYGITQIRNEYKQENTWLYRNIYIFKKEKRFSSQGTFRDEFHPDHPGGGLGKGTFIETKHFFILTYNFSPYSSDTIIYSYNPKCPNNAIEVKFVDFWGVSDGYAFFIEVLDTLANEKIYIEEFPYHTFTIPIDGLEFDNKVINNYNYEPIIPPIALNVPNGMNNMIIVRNFLNEIIYYDQPIKLRKISNGRLEDEKGHIFIKVKKKKLKKKEWFK